MAGHSHAKNVMFRKQVQNAKRAKIITKMAREILIAAKKGADPEKNSELRFAMQKARKANVPSDVIDRALTRATSGQDQDAYEEILYEGFTAGGAGLLIETMTDNRHRTAPQLRAILSKRGGNLASTNSVICLFQRVGRVVYPASGYTEEAIMEAALQAEARDVISHPTNHTFLFDPDHMSYGQETLHALLGECQHAERVWLPLAEPEPLTEEAQESLERLIADLHDNEDVQEVYTAYDAFLSQEE